MVHCFNVTPGVTAPDGTKYTVEEQDLVGRETSKRRTSELYRVAVQSLLKE
jgi:hypothetical protein